MPYITRCEAGNVAMGHHADVTSGKITLLVGYKQELVTPPQVIVFIGLVKR